MQSGRRPHAPVLRLLCGSEICTPNQREDARCLWPLAAGRIALRFGPLPSLGGRDRLPGVAAAGSSAIETRGSHFVPVKYKIPPHVGRTAASPEPQACR